MKLAFALVLLAALAGGAYYIFGNYGEGFRAGTVIKLSRKGLIFKTYEGQLNLGMVLGEQSGTSVSNIWEFSVPPSESEVLRLLDSAMMSGRRAKLHYREKFVRVPWRGDTPYQVYKVELSH